MCMEEKAICPDGIDLSMYPTGHNNNYENHFFHQIVVQQIEMQ